MLSTLSVLLISTLLCSAQYGTGRTRTIEGFDFGNLDFDDVRSPRYRPQGIFEDNDNDNWLRIGLEYRLGGDDDDWIDRLTLDWYVALTPDDDEPILLHRTIHYADVQGSHDHYAVVYVRPAILLRYYGDDTVSSSDVFIYLRVILDGEVAGFLRYNDDDAPDNWWQMTEPEVTVLENELLPRTETPFAPLDYGALEHIVED